MLLFVIHFNEITLMLFNRNILQEIVCLNLRVE